MISKDLVAASAKPLILSILASGEDYGYNIIQRIRTVSGGNIDWKDGMLYPVLHKMEQQGLLASEWRNMPSGRRRKYYRLQPYGRERIEVEKQQWLAVHNTLEKLWREQECLT